MDELSRKLKEIKETYLLEKNESCSFAGTPVELKNREELFSFIERCPLVAIDFWAPWCKPCQIFSPIINSIAKEMEGKMAFGKVNIEKNKFVIDVFNIRSIPTLLIFKNGKIVDRLVGVYKKEKLSERLKRHL